MSDASGVIPELCKQNHFMKMEYTGLGKLIGRPSIENPLNFLEYLDQDIDTLKNTFIEDFTPDVNRFKHFLKNISCDLFSIEVNKYGGRDLLPCPIIENIQLLQAIRIKQKLLFQVYEIVKFVVGYEGQVLESQLFKRGYSPSTLKEFRMQIKGCFSIYELNQKHPF